MLSGSHQQLSNKALISIITVVYNGAEYIEETIKSVINQTYQNIEYIIIDGGSTDGTVNIIKKYQNKINYFISEPDNGLYDAMNKGINISNGEWLNFLNAGDYFVDSYVIENIFKQDLQKSNLIYGNVYVILENGDTKFHSSKIIKDYKSIRSGMQICHQAIFYHKSIIEFYDINFKLKAEWKHLIKITRKLSFNPMKLDYPFVYYRVGGIGARKIKLNQYEYRKVFLKEYGITEYLKYTPFFLWMTLKRIIKTALLKVK